VSAATLHALVGWSMAACVAYLAIVYVSFLLLLIPSVREAVRLVRQGRYEDYGAIEDSPFTIPVSVILPASDEDRRIVAAVRALLALDYPQHEVVVVNDGSTDGTLQALREAFDLQPRESFVRRAFVTEPVRATYRSRSDERLVVIDKAAGGRADSLNCGVNAARYRYVCTVSADTLFYPKALSRAMRLVLRDPGRIVGATSQVTVGRSASRGLEGEGGGAARTPGTGLAVFQRLAGLRSGLTRSLGWSRLDSMLSSQGAFAIWRRDVVVELGGFSRRFTDETLEFTFRVHEHFRRLGRPYRVLAPGEAVGTTVGPASVWEIVRQQSRRQRIAAETVWHYRRMLVRRRYGTVGMLGVPWFLLVEGLAPFFELLAIAVVPIAWQIGDVTFRDLALLGLTVAFANGFLTNVALYLHDADARDGSLGDLLRGVVLGPADLVVYQPWLLVGRTIGLVSLLKGTRGTSGT
jgi:poly-beta-1,6-N-acetyl-D-glucosamine synthase